MSVLWALALGAVLSLSLCHAMGIGAAFRIKTR